MDTKQQITPNNVSLQQEQNNLPTNEMEINKVKTGSKANLILIILGLFALTLAGVGGYLLGKQSSKSTEIAETVNVIPSPKGETQVVCTLDAKICPDGSSVGRISPDCEFEACPSVGSNQVIDGWKMYKNDDLNISFQYPSSWEIIEKDNSGQDNLPKISIKVGDMLTISSYYDRKNNDFYLQNPELISEQSAHPDAKIGTEYYKLEKSKWEDGGANFGTEQATYFVDIPKLFSIDISYQIFKERKDDGSLVPIEYQIAGETISDTKFESDMDDIYKILSTVTFTK